MWAAFLLILVSEAKHGYFFLFLSEHEPCCDVSCVICELLDMFSLRQYCKSSGCSAASLQSQGENTQTAEPAL